MAFSSNGFADPMFFVGIVEDNVDPINSGRVRVRVFGLHPSYKSGDLPTSDLPWAVPVNGSYGGSSQIPRVTEWVFGFFADGRDAQHPFLLGTITGQNLMSMSGSGEPNESAYMRPSAEARRFYGAAPLRPAQSGENLHETQLILQDAIRLDAIAIASDGKPELFREKQGWSEPSSATSANPAQTTIFSSTYGDSYIEVSGQEDNEFINVSHASGSQVQIDQNGDIKIRSTGDLYNIAEGSIKEYSGGRRDVKIDGAYTIKVEGGDCTLEVDGDLNHVVHGDYNLNVGGRMTTSVGLGFEMAASRISMRAASEHINLSSQRAIRMQCAETISLTSDLNIMMNGGELIAMNAAEIHFNTPDKAVSELAMIAQIDQPTTFALGIEGNQGGISTVNPTSTTTGGAGNPNAANGTDDTVDITRENLNLPSTIKLNNGINSELPFIVPASAGVFFSGAVEGLQHTAIGGSGHGADFSGPNPPDVTMNGTLLSYQGRTNGGRITFRAGQNSSQLGTNVQVQWVDGKSYTIPNPNQRYDRQKKYGGVDIGLPFLWKPVSEKDGNPVILDY